LSRPINIKRGQFCSSFICAAAVCDRRRINQLAAPNRAPIHGGGNFALSVARSGYEREAIFLRPAGERQDYKSRDRSQQRDNSLGQTNFPGRREESTHTLTEKGREGRTNSQTQHTPSHHKWRDIVMQIPRCSFQGAVQIKKQHLLHLLPWLLSVHARERARQQ
jgi:hypothetical protein